MRELPSALVGHTGFVGGNLSKRHAFDLQYHSKNIEEIEGRELGLLVVSGMPAAMWIANGDPDADRACLERLWSPLSKAKAQTIVVISTVAVYPEPIEVNEDSPIDPKAQTAYGRHRLMLEERVAENFSRVLVVRLPGLYGEGLKKNAIYDFLHDHETAKLNSASVYQFYGLERLWHDISNSLHAGLSVVNFAVEPVSLAEVARVAFGFEFENDPGTPAANYDMRTKHSRIFRGPSDSPYMQSKSEVLEGLKSFVARERVSERRR